MLRSRRAALKVFQDLVLEKLDAGEAFGEAVLAGYQAFLCSGHFLYLPEPHDPSDHYTLASRLSHFLWNSRPDKELQDAARAGKLRSAAVLRKQNGAPDRESPVREVCRQFSWLLA